MNFEIRILNLWFFGDQHRRQALSCEGDPNVSTPNIDRLMVNGLSSSGAVAGFPLCSPFRGSLLTGRYPHQCVPGHQRPLPAEQQTQTIASAFKAGGYDTAWFGKWHVDGTQESQGRTAFHLVPRERRGDFDQWIGYENNMGSWDCWVHGHDGKGNEVLHYRLDGFETDALTDLLIAQLKEWGQNQKPFFAGVSVIPPHDPYVAPERWMKPHRPGRISFRPNVPDIRKVREEASVNLAGYYAMVENLDYNLGRVMEAVAQAGLGDNTHIMFFSDHGDMLGSQGMFRKTAPWEESIGIPFVMGGHQPFYDYRIGRQHLLVNHVDIAPTSLGLCGIKPPAAMSGFDYSGFRLRQVTPPTPPDSAYLQMVIPTGHAESIDRPWRGVVTRDGWKYACLEGQPWLMYNLNDDPYEQMNLAFNTKYGTERAKLQDRLAQWIHDTSDNFRLPVL